ncbi:hypothetical protein ACQJBY_058638 [Aegilops geniculata]
MLYLDNKAEEEMMDDEVDTVLMNKQNMPDRKSKNNKVSPGELSCERVPVKEEPNDSNGTRLNKDKHQDKVSSSSRVLRSGNKRRLRSVVISDSSEDECTETNMPEQKDKGACGNKKRVKAKAKNTMLEDEDEVWKAKPRRTRMLSR